MDASLNWVCGNTPFAVMSGTDLSTLTIQFPQARMISKPLDMKSLKKVVQELLDATNTPILSGLMRWLRRDFAEHSSQTTVQRAHSKRLDNQLHARGEGFGRGRISSVAGHQ